MKRLWILFLGAVFMLAAETAAAENFSRYSNEQLSSMRHAMQYADPERRLAYRQEVRRRFGVWIEFDGAPDDPSDDFWNEMDDHHGSAYGSGHHDGSYLENHYNRHSRSNRGGGGC